MSDVADMLGISAKSMAGTSASDEALKLMGDGVKTASKHMKKPKGMSREVFDLLGKDGIVPAAQGNALQVPSFKNKRVNALKGKWVWMPIENPARKNNPHVFYHWIKAESAYVEYPYASFNIKLDTFDYTATEYANHLSENSSWSKEDTDTLVRTCHEFDLRWPVVADRIQLSIARPIEELQARYYDVRSIIRSVRLGQTGGGVTKSSSFNFSNGSALAAAGDNRSGFDLEFERKRRRAQDLMFRK
jgi:hypothetical protein